MAKERGLSPQTVLNHLAMAMEAGHFVDYRRGMHHDNMHELCSVILHFYIMELAC